MTVQLNFHDIFKIKDCYYYVEFLPICICYMTKYVSIYSLFINCLYKHIVATDIQSV